MANSKLKGFDLKNPHKKDSKINPQVEDGYGQLNNDIMDNLILKLSTGAQFKLVFFIIRKTYGFHKLWDAIAISQFIEASGLSDRAVRENLKALKKAKIIHYVSLPHGAGLNAGSPLNAYLFNKHYDTWNHLSLHRGSGLKRNVSKPEVERSQACAVVQTQNIDKRKTKDNGAKKPAPPNPDVKKIADYFKVEYEDKIGVPYVSNYSKDRTILKRLLKPVGPYRPDQMKKLIDKLLSRTLTDQFILSTDRGIGILQSQVNKLAQYCREDKKLLDAVKIREQARASPTGPDPNVTEEGQAAGMALIKEFTEKRRMPQ